MIVGSGMIAKAFESYDKNDEYIIFASGVSDSTTSDQQSFEKEKNLLEETFIKYPRSIICYFSTCSIYDEKMKSNAYVKHKLKMEELITSKKRDYFIFRLSNPIGVTKNNKTFFNYFIDKLKTKEQFTLWDNSYRNIIDVDDVYAACKYILNDKMYINRTVNIVNPDNYSIRFIVESLEKHFEVKGNYNIINKDSNPVIDTRISKNIFELLHIKFGNDYMKKLLNKYFPTK